MKIAEGLRSADPARGLSKTELSKASSSLRREMSALVDHQERPSAPRSSSSRRSLVVTVLVAAAVVAVGVAVALPRSAPAPAPAGTSAIEGDLEGDLDRLLDPVRAKGMAIDDRPVLSWSDKRTGAQGGLSDLTGQTIYLVGVCDSGGEIVVRISGEPDLAINCASSSSFGPVDLSDRIKSSGQGVNVDVQVEAGHPRYLVESVAAQAQ